MSISCFLVLATAVLGLYRGTIFQRGNPIPYIGKMVNLNEGNSYAKVFADEDIYISRIRDKKLIGHIENAYKVTFIEQLGSAYLFVSDEKSVIAKTEIYWRNYLVWELTIQALNS
jgi:hypothetical protein